MKIQSRLMFGALTALVIAAFGALAIWPAVHSPTLAAQRQIKVVTTVGMVTDIVQIVGGERVAVTGLMGPGVDPHLFRASEGDVRRLAEAEIIFYSGLNLEAKLGDVLKRFGSRVKTVAVTDGIDRGLLLEADDSPDLAEEHDPHVWHDVSLWMKSVETVRDALVAFDGSGAAIYQANASRYLADMASAHQDAIAQSQRVPADQRVLITSHDAFRYFGRAYGFEVRGLQGISTATEAGAADVQTLAEYIASRRIRAIFVESSVPQRNIEAVQAAVKARGFDVKIGGELYSDALGDPGTEAASYLGMIKANVTTVVSALVGE